MTTPRQKRQKKKVSRKSKSNNLNFCMPLIKKAWDTKKTLSQNYSQIGLQSFLNGKAGGDLNYSVNYSLLKSKLGNIKDELKTEFRDLSFTNSESVSESKELLIGEPVYDFDDRVKNLGSRVNLKKLRNFSIIDQTESKTEIVDQLRELSNLPSTVKRINSGNELILLKALKEKYADDYQGMSRDLKLNLYQLSPGQLKKKFKRFSL